MYLRKVRRGTERLRGARTDTNDQRADGKTGDGVLHQVRGAGTQEGRRRPHLRIVVGRLERFATPVSGGHSQYVRRMGALTSPWCLLGLRWCNRLFRRGTSRCLARRR